MHFHWLLQVEHVSTKAALHTTVHQGQTENEDTTPGGMYTIYQGRLEWTNRFCHFQLLSFPVGLFSTMLSFRKLHNR